MGTPKRSLSNIHSATNRIFESDDDENENENETQQNADYSLFECTPPSKKNKKRSKSQHDAVGIDDDDLITFNNGFDSNNSPRFSSQLLISKSYHRDFKKNTNRRAWSVDECDRDCVLITSPTTQRTSLFEDYVHIATS